MPESRPRYANFPEREPKVIIGPNIAASATKQLTRLSIGTYEMSVAQQERCQQTVDSAKSVLTTLGKSEPLTISAEKTRDFAGSLVAVGATVQYRIWVTTPFEPGQAAHIVWVKWSELEGEKKVGIAFKLSTGFTSDDIANVVKAAQKNAVVLGEGEAFTLKGNPPPRFQKKAAAEPAPAAAAVAEGPKPAEALAPPPRPVDGPIPAPQG
jgi:hypothetical protein